MKTLKFLAVVWLVACESDKDEGGAEAGPVASQACVYDFTADVREGPDAPLTLAGQLTLAQRDDAGNLMGELVLLDESVVLATGRALDDEAIYLRFELPDGRTIEGAGPLPSPLSDCAGEMEGELVGPAVGDRGDWLASPNVFQTVCVEIQDPCYVRERTNAECRDSYCSLDFNLLPGETAGECRERCRAGDLSTLIYICGSNNCGGVSTFFGCSNSQNTCG